MQICPKPLIRSSLQDFHHGALFCTPANFAPRLNLQTIFFFCPCSSLPQIFTCRRILQPLNYKPRVEWYGWYQYIQLMQCPYIHICKFCMRLSYYENPEHSCTNMGHYSQPAAEKTSDIALGKYLSYEHMQPWNRILSESVKHNFCPKKRRDWCSRADSMFGLWFLTMGRSWDGGDFKSWIYSYAMHICGVFGILYLKRRKINISRSLSAGLNYSWTSVFGPASPAPALSGSVVHCGVLKRERKLHNIAAYLDYLEPSRGQRQ